MATVQSLQLEIDKLEERIASISTENTLLERAGLTPEQVRTAEADIKATSADGRSPGFEQTTRILLNAKTLGWQPGTPFRSWWLQNRNRFDTDAKRGELGLITSRDMSATRRQFGNQGTELGRQITSLKNQQQDLREQGGAQAPGVLASPLSGTQGGGFDVVDAQGNVRGHTNNPNLNPGEGLRLVPAGQGGSGGQGRDAPVINARKDPEPDPDPDGEGGTGVLPWWDESLLGAIPQRTEERPIIGQDANGNPTVTGFEQVVIGPDWAQINRVFSLAQSGALGPQLQQRVQAQDSGPSVQDLMAQAIVAGDFDRAREIALTQGGTSSNQQAFDRAADLQQQGVENLETERTNQQRELAAKRANDINASELALKLDIQEFNKRMEQKQFQLDETDQLQARRLEQEQFNLDTVQQEFENEFGLRAQGFLEETRRRELSLNEELGRGNLDVSRGQLDLQRNEQQFSQGERRLNSALEFARSPADSLAISLGLAGQLPLGGGVEGQLQRLGQRSGFLQNAAGNFFGGDSFSGPLSNSQLTGSTNVQTGQFFPGVTGQRGTGDETINLNSPLAASGRQQNFQQGQLSDFLPVRLNQALAGQAIQPGKPLLPQVGIRPLSAQALRNLGPTEREQFGELTRLSGIPQAELENELQQHQPLSTSRTRISLAGSRV